MGGRGASGERSSADGVGGVGERRGPRINYNGDRALSLQTLWRGPFVRDAILDGARDVSEHLPVLLGQHEARWKERRTHFYADSGSSATKFLDAIREAQFTHWSVSYNKWTEVLERLARELPEDRWSSPNEKGEEFTWLRHTPGEAQTSEVVRQPFFIFSFHVSLGC